MMKHKQLILIAACMLMLLGACGTKKGDTPLREESLELLDARIKKNPDDADLYFQRGQLLINLGKQKQNSQYFREAISDLNHAIKLENDKPEYYTALGDAHFSLGNVGDSYAALQEALKLDENNFEACLKMGEISFYSKDYDRAIESLNRVTAQDKDNQTAHFMKGFIYKETGDTTNAVFYFRRLIDLYPDYEPAYEELGMLYAQHRNKLGLEYLNTALSLQPDNVNVLYGLGMLYQDVEDADKANEYYARINAIDSTFKYAWFNRGYMEMVFYEDYNNAVDFFNKAIQCDPQYAEAYYNRGLSYQLMGDNAKADADFAQAKTLGMEVPNAK